VATKSRPAPAQVFVPRGTPHTYWNPGPGPVRYLLVMTANIFGLIQDIHAMPERTPAALQAVFRKHDSDLAEMPRPGFVL
jgi:hypothetical protein